MKTLLKPLFWIPILALMAVVLLPANAQGNTYYVAANGNDNQAGSESQPFRTLGRGVQALRPGDTLLVKEGLYQEDLFNKIPSGESWDRAITLRAYPGHSVTIMPGPGAQRVISITGSRHHIIIDGFILDGTNTRYETIKIAGTSSTTEPSPHHIRIINNEIRNAGAAQSSNGKYQYFSAGILTTGNSNYVEYINNTIHNNGVTDYDHGIYHTASYGLIEGNTIYNNMGSGIKVGWGQDAVDNIVRNNLVYDNNRAEGADGQKKQGRGIGVYAGSGTLVYNNIIRGAHHSGIDVTYGGNNAQVFNNTIYNQTGYGIVVGYGSDGTKNAENTLVRNNIVYQQATLPAIYNLRGINTRIEHNLTYGMNPAIDKRANTNAVIQNNLENIDPLFVDPQNGNFSLSPNSPAVDAGVMQNNLIVDFLGQPRPQGNGLDLGAVELHHGAQPQPTLELTEEPPLEPTEAPTLEPTLAPTVELPAPVNPTALLSVNASGETVDVVVNLHNMDNLYGIQASCQTDAVVLNGIELVSSPETIFNNANSVFVDQGHQNGQWVVAVSRIKPAPVFGGDSTAFTLRYQRLSAAGSPVNCEMLAVDPNGQLLPLDVVNTVVEPVVPTEPTEEITPEPTLMPTDEPTLEPTIEPTEAPTLEPTIEPTAEVTDEPGITPEPTLPAPETGVISGIAYYQGRQDHTAIQVTLLLEGEIVTEAQTDASGFYSLSDVPVGAYTLRLGAPQHLTQAHAITVDGPMLEMGETTLLAGDVDNNAVIDILDAGLVGANFNLTGEDLPPADINADQRIDIRDLVLVGSNFGAEGAP